MIELENGMTNMESGVIELYCRIGRIERLLDQLEVQTWRTQS